MYRVEQRTPGRPRRPSSSWNHVSSWVWFSALPCLDQLLCKPHKVYRPHLLATDERNEKSGSLSPIDLRDKNDINESLCLTLKVLKHEGRHDTYSNDLNRDQHFSKRGLSVSPLQLLRCYCSFEFSLQVEFEYPSVPQKSRYLKLIVVPQKSRYQKY